MVGPVHEVAFPVGVGDRELGGHVAQVVAGEQDVGRLADGADHEHVVAGEVEHLLGQLEPFLRAELGEAELALPVEVAFPLLGRLDAGQLAAVVGQLALAALDQPASGFPLVVAAGHVEVAVQAHAAGPRAVVDPVPELGYGVDPARLQHELVGRDVVAPGGIVHQPRRDAQVDLRPLRDLQLEQLADVDRAAGARGDLDGQVGAVREGAEAVAVAPGQAHLVEQAGGLFRIVLGPQPLPLRLVEAGGGVDGGRGGPAQAKEYIFTL